MSSEQHRDQRKSYRCAVAEPCRKCEFKVGECVISARLVDESAGGFSVLVHHPPELTNGQTAQLLAGAGWCNVRIVHIREIVLKKSVEGEEKVEDAESGPWFRLGLRRLGDSASSEQPAVSLFAGSLWCRLGQGQSSSLMPMIFLGVLLAVLAVAAPLGIQKWVGHIGLSDTKVSVQRDLATTGSTTPNKQNAAPSPLAVQNRQEQPRAAVPQAAVPQAETKTSSTSSAVERLISMLDLPGAAPFQLPKVVERLQLTAAQQRQIEQLSETTSEALRKLAVELRGLQRQEISQRREQLLEEARRQALDLLTEQQQAEWQKLIEGR